MNWKIYEWIGVQFFFGKICEWIGRYTNELWFRFFLEGKIYEWIGTYTNELGFRFFFRIINIYFIFRIGGLGFWNPKIYEWIGVQIFFWKIYDWIGRYTNELWFRFCLEGKIYEWIGRYTNELGFRFFFGIINIYFIFSIGGLGFWNPNKRNKINIYVFNLFYLFSPELQILINKINKINIYFFLFYLFYLFSQKL